MAINRAAPTVQSPMKIDIFHKKTTLFGSVSEASSLSLNSLKRLKRSISSIVIERNIHQNYLSIEW